MFGIINLTVSLDYARLIVKLWWFQGAATTCYVALHPQVKGKTGLYFVDSHLAETNVQANDSELARKLWDFSLSLVNYCPHTS